MQRETPEVRATQSASRTLNQSAFLLHNSHPKTRVVESTGEIVRFTDKRCGVCRHGVAAIFAEPERRRLDTPVDAVPGTDETGTTTSPPADERDWYTA